MDIKNFLGLDKRKLVLFTIFAIITYFGMIQSWAFCKECSPKPFLYDSLSGFPFWSLWVYLSAPIQLVAGFLAQGAFLFLISLVYFYVIICFMVYSFDMHRANFSKKLIGFWAILFIVLNLYNLVALPILAGLGEQILVSEIQPSPFETVGNYLVEIVSFAFYAYLISCIFFIAKNNLRARKMGKRSQSKLLS